MLLLPLFVRELGASNAELGSVMATAAIGGLLFRPAAGWCLDHLGRKPTLIGATVILAGAMGMLGIVTDLGPTLFAARFLIGVGAGTLMTGYFTFVADFIPGSRRTEGLALFGISGLCPIAANAVFPRMDIAPAELNAMYPILALIVLSSAIPVWFVPETLRSRSDADGDGNSAPVSQVVLRSTLRPTWLATAVFSTLVAVFMTFVTVAATERQVEFPGDLWAAYAVGAITVRLFGARIPDRIGPYNLIAPALALYAGACLMAAETYTSTGFITAGCLAGLAHGYCFPILTSQVVTRIDREVRGMGMALFTAIWEITSLVAPPVFGLIADRTSSAVMFASAALGVVVCATAWAALEHHYQPHKIEKLPHR